MTLFFLCEYYQSWFLDQHDHHLVYRSYGLYFPQFFVYRCNGVVVRASVSQSVDMEFNPLVLSHQKTLKMVCTAFLLGAWYLGDVVENKSASSLVMSLGKALNRTPPPLCGRQVARYLGNAQTPRKWQLRSECGRPVQKIAKQFAYSGWRINMAKKVMLLSQMFVQWSPRSCLNWYVLTWYSDDMICRGKIASYFGETFFYFA